MEIWRLYRIIIVLYATFNNISVISWRSVLLLEETGVPRENKPQTCRKSLTNLITVIEEFEDTKGTIIISISKKNRHNNGQKKKYKMTNNDLQNIHIKLKIE
jgi:hypothetical protein